MPTYYYRPQRSCGQGYVFTRVCDSVNRGECLEQTPPDQTPPWTRHTPPRPDPPGTKYTPPGLSTPPRTKYTSPEADSGIRSTSGRYASYWNAFLFDIISENCMKLKEMRSGVDWGLPQAPRWIFNDTVDYLLCRCRNESLVHQNLVQINQNLVQINPPNLVLQSEVNSHRQSRAKTKKSQFLCEMCERKFTSEAWYRNHLNVSTVVTDNMGYIDHSKNTGKAKD